MSVVYWFLLVLPAAPVIVLAQILGAPKAVLFPLFGMILIWYVCAGWLASKAATSRVGGAGFGEAMLAGIPEGRATLSFLPIVGRLFESK